MKTDDLISMLSTGVAPVDPGFANKRLQLALTGGIALSFLLMVLLYGINPNLKDASALPMFWVKLALPASLFAVGLLLVLRVSIPGRPWRAIAPMAALPLLAIFLLAAGVLFNATPDERLPLILGKTWAVCTRNIALVSLPIFVAVFWMMKGLAPTQLSLAGACAGLMAGAMGTLVYALHCPEMSAPFIAVWYTAGIVLTTGLGAMASRRLLHW